MSTIKNDLLQLVKLQQIDLRVHDLQSEINELPAKKTALNQTLEGFNNKVSEAELIYKNKVKEQKDLENDMLSKEDLIKKFLTQQSQVKTNQEYKALTSEIESAKADKSMLEDKVIEMLDDIDAAKKAFDESKQLLESEKQKIADQVKHIDERINSLKNDLDAVKKDREPFVKAIDHEIYDQYQKIIKKRDGSGIAYLNGQNCSGCGFTLPPQNINEARIMDELVFCENCSRILYDQELVVEQNV